MKKTVGIFKGVMTLFLISGFLIGPAVTLAVTPPDRTFGITATYSVYGDAGITNTGGGTSPTRVWGNVGDNNVIGGTFLTSVQVPSGIIDHSTANGTAIRNDASSVYDSLMDSSQGTPAIISLAGSQTVTPGVYTVDATQTLSGTITLSGAGVYIFRSDSAYTVANSAKVVLTNGACASNVFWAIPTSMTIGTYADVEGTIIAQTGLISLATGATLVGRAISLTKAVTLDANQITEPTCAAASGSTTRYGTINVVKTVINDGGGTKVVADFPLFVNDMFVASGITNRFGASNIQAYQYKVTEKMDPNYTQSFSGDCDASGIVRLNPNENKFCIITNNDINAPMVTALVPPLIDVVKVPSPLSLPNGPGLVNYTYTLRNIGTVPVTNITMVGDTCSPIVLASGDTNSDGKLDLSETWVHTCSTNLTETHTNTVVATGWANGLSATDIASANVVVGLPIVPPLIHVTKVPAPFTLLAGGGLVTYTEKITNPGTVALSNVKIGDDKCSNVIYLSGDTNNNAKLDTTETWTYTCKTNLTATTMNTVSVTGEANGLIARDFAIATVVVAAAVPALPNTGLPEATSTPWGMIALSGLIILALTSSILVLKKRA